MTASVPAADQLAAQSILPVLNHLLAQDAWARTLLGAHGGKCAALDLGGFKPVLQVCADGLLQSAAPDADCAVTIHLKAADLTWLLQDRARLMAAARIEGDVELANTLSQLMNNMRWDMEYDLQRIFGEIGARRIAMAWRDLQAGAQQNTRKLQENIAEFLLEEQAMLVRPAAVEEFSQQVAKLRDDLERLEKRVQKVERATAPAQD
ncbi:SCP2 sterol-binding domain-containing protein [Massilia sp. W12]|uniref:ubiquinone biosynthesis accessory factor UbiJ n=1 Tax=Massilia sp. W12 TaxID=3126507 RepID=UPI0030CDFE46